MCDTLMGLIFSNFANFTHFRESSWKSNQKSVPLSNSYRTVQSTIWKIFSDSSFFVLIFFEPLGEDSRGFLFSLKEKF